MGENTREKSYSIDQKNIFQPSASRYSQISDEVLDAWIAEFSAPEQTGSNVGTTPEISDDELFRMLAETPAERRRRPDSVQPRTERRTTRPAERPVRRKRKRINPVFLIVKGVITIAAAVICTVFTVNMITTVLTASGTAGAVSSGSVNKAIMDHYDMFMTNEIADALDGVLAIEKVHWLNDNDIAAPKPNPANYGQAESPAELMWLLEEAKELIGDRTLTFCETTPVWEMDKIYYYYDETILVITWKQSMDGVIHTVSEVIVSHPSQFRRGLAGGTFGSDKQFTATEIAQSVNAVVATSGDFYKFRRNGIIVHNGELKRFEGESVDTCFIDDNGDLLFVKRGELETEAQAKQYIEEHNVRFSLAFGPVMVENGQNVTPYNYEIGQIRGRYTRAAVGQKGDKHYLFVNTSSYMAYNLTDRLTLKEFSDNLIELGAHSAYALDGGQTTVIAMDGKLISLPDYEQQRQISDIIYFATALPDGE